MHGHLDATRLAKLEWAWFQVLRSSTHHCKSLFEALSCDAKFFHDVLALIFRSENDHKREPTEDERARAHQGWQLLKDWKRLPGVDDSGAVDAAHLKQWVTTVRELCRHSGRAKIGDEQLGEVLADSPPGTDGHWPHQAVRDVVEEASDREHMMRGFHVGAFNRRGVFSKAIAGGGEQERAIASRYAADATALANKWPVTASALRDLAHSYKSDATREDLRADLTKDDLGI